MNYFKFTFNKLFISGTNFNTLIFYRENDTWTPIYSDDFLPLNEQIGYYFVIVSKNNEEYTYKYYNVYQSNYFLITTLINLPFDIYNPLTQVSSKRIKLF